MIEASRPFMPGYGILGPEEGSGLLPWSWAVERLSASHDYWLATIGAAGQPHVMPVWGVWRAGALWFSSAGSSRKARNLAADPRCTVATDDPRNPVVIQAAATQHTDRREIEEFAAAVNAKYGTAYGVDFFASNACFSVSPWWAFGLASDDFAGSPTRWRIMGE